MYKHNAVAWAFGRTTGISETCGAGPVLQSLDSCAVLSIEPQHTYLTCEQHKIYRYPPVCPKSSTHTNSQAPLPVSVRVIELRQTPPSGKSSSTR